MPLSHEHVGSKIVAKIKIYILTRAELLFTLCYEIPCNLQLDKSKWHNLLDIIDDTSMSYDLRWDNKTRAASSYV